MNLHQHERLRSHPFLWGTVGVLHTLLSAGIVFGWASLLPVLREVGVNRSPQDFSNIFTLGAIGNYISTLFFGTILDRFGPRATGIASSLLFALGLVLCANTHSFFCLSSGFALLGFAGPGIQLPTLHLANLYKSSSIFMSAQAAAFDGGTAVFAIYRSVFQSTGLSTSTFFLLYLIIPAWVFLTSVYFWPREIMGKEIEQPEEYVGTGSPYLSPARRCSERGGTATLKNAPLSTVLRHSAFLSLAIWVSIHILKLNFIVATINDQLNSEIDDPAKVSRLIDAFGVMLPFGFVALPVVATILEKSVASALQVANVVGFVYGGVLVLCPKNEWLQALIVFPSVAISRQMVYSTVFHQIGQEFGFANYGVLLGLTNVCVSTFSTIQTPLVDWSERVGTYLGSNLLLWLMTVPLFGIVLWSTPSSTRSSSHSRDGFSSERSPLNKTRTDEEDCRGEVISRSNSFV